MATASTSTLHANFKVSYPPLGEGSYGAVLKGTIENRSSTHPIFHVPKFPIPKLPDEPTLETTFALKLIPYGLLGEVVAMSSTCHPNIVQCYNAWVEEDTDLLDYISKLDDSCDNPNRSSVLEVKGKTTMHHLPTVLILQLEFCETTMEDWIINRNPEEFERIITFAQLVDALVYLQTKKMVHGDLKLNNVLITRSNYNGEVIAKLADFGLINHHAKMIVTTSENLGKVDESELKNYVETRPRFMCPLLAKLGFLKMVHGETVTGATHKNDIYSLGLIWMCLLLRFKDSIELKNVVGKAMAHPSKGKNIPVELKEKFPQEEELIMKMIDWDVDLRPNADQVLKNIHNPAYKISIDLSQNKRNQIQSMVEILEKVLNSEMDDLDANLKTLKKREGHFLIEIISQVERHLNPMEELWWTAIENLNKYEDLKSGDAIFWYRKLISKCGDDDNVKLLKMKLILAMNTEDKDEGALLFQNLVSSPTFQDLDLLDPVRIQTQVAHWEMQYSGFGDKNDPSSSDDLDQVQKVLIQAEEMYTALVNIKNMDPLYDTITMFLFTVIINLLTRLGKSDQAENRLLHVINSSDFGEDSSSIPPQHYTLVAKYCMLLSHLGKNDEAIAMMEPMHDLHMALGDVPNAINALHHLVGFSYEQESGAKKDENSVGSTDSLLCKYMEKIVRLDNDVFKSGNLLINGDELQFDDDVVLRTRFPNFKEVE